MAWPIAELARESGITSRTLRRYGAIGLLRPAWTHSNGWRRYEREQLLRLQRILLLRDLGLSLDGVVKVLALSEESDALEVLRKHRDWLLAERRRLARLVATRRYRAGDRRRDRGRPRARAHPGSVDGGSTTCSW